jgi:membrane protein
MTDATAHGRNATKPTDIPAAGWKDILWRVKDEVTEDRVMLIAAGVTFYILLALVPALTAMVSIYGLFSDPQQVGEQLAQLQGFIPGGGMEVLQDQMSRLAEQDESSLGIAFLVSLALSLWSANAGIKSLFEAMNVAYEETEKRGFIKLNLISLAFTLCGIVAVILASIVFVALPVILDVLGFGSMAEWIIRIVSYLVLAGLAVTFLAALYRYGPSRDKAEWAWITVGSIVTLVVWVIGSLLFTWYAANMGSYNATYGSLGSLIGFLFWIWISVNIVIVGAELNAEIEHQTAVDTTVGPDKPMGSRGATMADTLGKSKGGTKRG